MLQVIKSHKQTPDTKKTMSKEKDKRHKLVFCTKKNSVFLKNLHPWKEFSHSSISSNLQTCGNKIPLYAWMGLYCCVNVNSTSGQIQRLQCESYFGGQMLSLIMCCVLIFPLPGTICGVCCGLLAQKHRQAV